VIVVPPGTVVTGVCWSQNREFGSVAEQSYGWRLDMAYFAFQQRPEQEFIFELMDEGKIAHARRILSGGNKSRCMSSAGS
jgi:hypothetical protein